MEFKIELINDIEEVKKQLIFDFNEVEKEKIEIIFDFKKAIIDSVRPIPLTIDERSTIGHPELGSWRRDKKVGDGTQNKLVIYRGDAGIQTKFFHPKESVKAFFKRNNF